jgi:hypothetical protein
MEYATNTSTAYANTFNAINIFGTSLSYVTSNNNNMIKNDPHIHGVFIVVTLVFLPISLLTVGMAHSLEHRMK